MLFTMEIIGSNWIHLKETDSTNSFLKELHISNPVSEGTCITADYQHAGRGQSGNIWQSADGENFLFSTIIFPKNITPASQFSISMAFALGVHSFLSDYLPFERIKIKWPNDILFDGKKICGMLIENALQGECITNSIIGIGLNVNQTENLPPDATSLAKLTGEKYELQILYKDFFSYLNAQLINLYKMRLGFIESNYLEVLHGHKTPLPFSHPEGGTFMGTIMGVSKEGRLIVESGSESRHYNTKEIIFQL